MHKAAAARAEDDMRATMGVFPPGHSPWASHSLSYMLHPLDLMEELCGLSSVEPNFSFGASDEDELSQQQSMAWC